MMRYKKFLLTVVCAFQCAVAIAGGNSAIKPSPFFELTKAIDEHEISKYAGDSRSSDLNLLLDNILAIGLEKRFCRGMCPDYWVYFEKGGGVQYYASAYMPTLGYHESSVSTLYFSVISEFIADMEIMEMDNHFSDQSSDSSNVYLYIKTKDGEKIIRNLANSGPSKLWVIENAIENITRKVFDHNYIKTSGTKTSGESSGTGTAKKEQ